MSADNWKELLQRPEVERVVQEAVRAVRSRYFGHSRGTLISDDFESYAWDEAVNLAERYDGHQESFHKFLFAGLTGYGQLRHYEEFVGPSGTPRREAHNTSTSIDAAIEEYGSHAEALILNTNSRANDPIRILMNMEALEGHIRRAETLQHHQGQHNVESSPYCSEDLCFRPVYRTGLCSHHYAQQRKHWGNAAGTTPTCSEPNCPLISQGRGLCALHYHQERRRRIEQNDPWPQIPTKTCSAIDCNRPVKGRGLCLKHYQRARTASNPPCNIPGCDNPTTCKGMCSMHYQRWRKTHTTNPEEHTT